MADKKLEKALYGPSTMEVALGAALGLFLGLALAVVFLVLQPVTKVTELPKEIAKGKVYYIAGESNSAKARDLKSKEEIFVRGGSVSFNEAELNAWVGSQGAANAKPDTKPAAPGFVALSGLNFRIVGDRVQIALKASFDVFGFTRDVTLQTVGTFAKNGEGFAFVPEQLYLGSCPVHTVPGATTLLASRALAQQEGSDEFRSAWAKVKAITVANGLLNITTQP
ncbi:MAG: hypothetical protein Q8J74_13280 [Candidatus Didemnitutus sp.]|nr:hypothetical protein [Candidatus Didemnitutus sp.]